MDNENASNEEVNKPLTVDDFVKTVNVPFSDRLLQAATNLFGQVFAGLTMMLIAPFSAIRILLKSEMTVPDLTKIPVHYVDGTSVAPHGQGGLAMPTEEELKQVNKTVIDMFDMREPWQREHDEIFGEENDDASKN